MEFRKGTIGILVITLLLLGSCSRTVVDFEVLDCDPRPDSAISLNQEICLTFSRYLDPTSVNERTVQVLDHTGRPVVGELAVMGKFVTFKPRPHLKKDLSDGGFRPGGSYRVLVPGFPKLDTVRTRDRIGETLQSSFQRDLKAINLDSGNGGQPVFIDTPSPRFGACPVFQERAKDNPELMVLRVRAGMNPRITFSERLDPRFVTPPGPFELASFDNEQRISLNDVRLVADGVKESLLGRVVEIVPSVPLLPGTDYRLWVRQGYSMFDYNGNPMSMGLLAPGEPLFVLLKVTPRLGDEFFSSAQDCDLQTSTDEAWGWWGNGELTACLLKEAGDGSLGSFFLRRDLDLVPGEMVRIDGREAFVCPLDCDLDFSRIQIPAGVTLTLKSPGPWVIRSQGPFSMQGTILVEGCGGDPEAPRGGTLCVPEKLVAERLSLLSGGGLIMVSSGNLSLTGKIQHAGHQGVVLISGGLVLVGAQAHVAGGWVERVDRIPYRPLVEVCDTRISTGLLPDRKETGWVSEPMEIFVRSRFRELPPGDGRLAQPVINTVNTKDLKVTIQGAPASRMEPGLPDMSRLTPWYSQTDMGALQDCLFFRFRLQFTVPVGRNAPLPKVTTFLLRRE